MDMKEKREHLNEEWKLDKDEDQVIDFEDVEMDEDPEDEENAS